MRTTHYSQQQDVKAYIGIDNGVSGSVGVTFSNGMNPVFFRTPVRKHLSYTKKAKGINRIDFDGLVELLKPIVSKHQSQAVLERPMVNPRRFDATTSAVRALEATLIALEALGVPYLFVDSKEWQKDMLPKGLKGSDALKLASVEVGRRLFPQFQHLFKGDADGMLMAEWARRKKL